MRLKMTGGRCARFPFCSSEVKNTPNLEQQHSEIPNLNFRLNFSLSEQKEDEHNYSAVSVKCNSEKKPTSHPGLCVRESGDDCVKGTSASSESYVKKRGDVICKKSDTARPQTEAV